MRANEGLAQVFDGNTDFISQSPTAAKTLHTVTAATCVQAAFQLDELASMDKTNINGSHRRGDLIPYDKSAIKILKEKRKTKAFCRFEKRNNHRQLPITDIETVIEEDATSEASSDISSVTSLQSISGDCSVTMINGNWGLKSAFDLADVHGGPERNKALDAQVQMRKLSRRLEFLRKENEQYANVAKEIPDYKQEVFSLKSSNFELQRENANLKSQLEATAMDNQMISEIKSNVQEVPMQSECDHRSRIQDSKQQLWQIQDENLQLRSEMVRFKLDVKNRDDSVKRLEATHDALDIANLELAATNQKLMQKLRETEANCQSMQRSKLALEQNLSVFQSERDSFVKSRDWYRDQMHAAQESRSAIQHELISLQSESASKSNQIEKLKGELLGTNKTLEDEREKGLHEKEDMKRQLEELEVSLVASEEAHSLVLSDDNDDEITEEDGDLKIQLQVLKNDFHEIEARNQELENRLRDFDAVSEALKVKLDGSQLRINQMEDKEIELIASKAMLSEDLELKTKLIKELAETKVNAELDLNRTKNDFKELRTSCQRQSDENQDLKDDLRKHKEKLEKTNGDLDTIALELKLSKCEHSQRKVGLENVQEVQQENIMLKKQLLNHDRELVEENANLKKAFAASDEARGELETAFDLIKENYELLKTEMSNVQNSTTECLNHEENMLELQKIIDEKSNLNESLQQQNDELNSKLSSLLEETLQNNTESDDDDEELKTIQAQKISRLESSTKIYKTEIRQLTQKVIELEEQMLTLEHKNGRLIMDSNQNVSLKGKIQKLQEAIAKDTALRRELLSSLELAKFSLRSDIESLEKSRNCEKEAHCETKNRLMLQEHECATLRVDRRSLRTGLETANLTIDKLKQELFEAKNESSKDDLVDVENVPGIQVDFELSQAHLNEVKATYEDAKRTINGLEDHLAEVKFQLKQKGAEMASLQSVLKTRDESYQAEVTELRSKSDYLRLELVNLTRKVDKLSEEKNGYRAQVQDMNMALKNSLEHIKRLRTARSENHDEWNELISSQTFTPSPEPNQVQKQNLVNLQNCLGSLKYEMAVLQNKLAPAASPYNSPSKSKVQSEHSIKTEDNL